MMKKRFLIVVVSTLLAWGGCGCRSITHSFAFGQMCDPQLGMGGYKEDMQRFEKAVKQINELHPDFVVICGDLVNRSDRASFDDFNSIKRKFTVPCYCAPGNHDVGNSPTRQLLNQYR